MVKTPDKTNQWIFHDVQYITGDGLHGYQINTAMVQKNEEIENLTALVAAKDAEIEKYRQTLAQLEQEYISQLTILGTQFDKIQTAMPTMSDEVSHRMVILVKHLVTKLIQREINEDESTLLHMIQGLATELHINKIMCVEVCEHDYDILKKVSTNCDFNIVINKELTSGDVIISTDTNSYIQRIQQYIDNVIKDKHE